MQTFASEIKSPFTGGRVKEVIKDEVQTFRKEKYVVKSHYYVCEETNEEFTTTEQDSKTFEDLYSQYRKRHGIPTPQEIKDIRLSYGLNYTQITKILGFGTNQYKQYEDGQVPSESNGKLIQTIKDKSNMLNLLKLSKDKFSEEELERIKEGIA